MDIIDKYIRFKANPENDKKDDTFFCTEVGVSINELRKVKRNYKTWAKEALGIRRDHYSEKMVEIDRALFQAAKSGDTKAADLLYRRFDGWNPKIIEQNNNFYNFADLVKGLKTKVKPTIVRRDLPTPDGE